MPEERAQSDKSRSTIGHGMLSVCSTLSMAIRRSLSEVSLAQLAGLDTRTPTMPIERELKYMARAKAVPRETP